MNSTKDKKTEKRDFIKKNSSKISNNRTHTPNFSDKKSNLFTISCHN